MKHINLFKFARVGALALILTILTIVSVSAQSGNTNSTGNNRTETRVVERDNDTDWGWLGLLGLLGLAGLLQKKRQVEVQQFKDTRNDETTNRS